MEAKLEENVTATPAEDELDTAGRLQLVVDAKDSDAMAAILDAERSVA
mgnify:CR=1 FL=1